MLSDSEIIRAIKRGEISILIEEDGVDKDVISKTGKYHSDSIGALQAHGYDLRMRAIRWGLNSPWIELDSLPGFSVQLPPGKTVEIKTLEKLALKDCIGATVHSMVRMRRTGLSPISTTVHPTWGTGTKGPQHLEVHVTNIGTLPIRLEYGDRFCRIVFYRLSKPATLEPPAWDVIELWEKRQLSVYEDEQRQIARKQEQAVKRWATVSPIIVVITAMVLALIVFQQVPLETAATVTGAAIIPLMIWILNILTKYYDKRRVHFSEKLGA